MVTRRGVHPLEQADQVKAASQRETVCRQNRMLPVTPFRSRQCRANLDKRPAPSSLVPIVEAITASHPCRAET